MNPRGSFLLALLLALLAAAVHAAAQSPSTGAVEFVAHVTPTGARAEPARQLTFYLLRKSFAEIHKESEDAEPKPDLHKFIDALEVSPELKAWMKKQRSVELGGTDFIRRLKADDIMNVPEFNDAYMRRNSGDVPFGFPAPKFRPQDAQQNPQKYQKQAEEYRQQIRRYIETNPQSVDGIDVHLDAINPAQRWAQQETERHRRIQKHALELALTRFLVAKTDTDLEGHGELTGVPTGDYWLTTLDAEAIAGDARLRWNVPVKVRAGQTTRLELSNLNSGSLIR